MCSGTFQPFILHITCMQFAATLAKPEHVGNAFTSLNLFLRTKLLYDCCPKQWLFFFFHMPFFKIKHFLLLFYFDASNEQPYFLLSKTRIIVSIMSGLLNLLIGQFDYFINFDSFV